MQVRLKGIALKRARRMFAALRRDGFPVSMAAMVNDLVSRKAKEQLDYNIAKRREFRLDPMRRDPWVKTVLNAK